MIELDEILSLAARMDSDDPGADFDAALDRLTTAELRDVMLAGKMLAGRPLRTDNPQDRRASACAGGSVREIETRNGLFPDLRQIATSGQDPQSNQRK